MSTRPTLLQLKPRTQRLSPPIASVAAIPSASTLPASAPFAQGLLDSDDLLRGGREVLIRHGDEVYRLRHTRNDKLILTK
ncbi:hemin uptake protein HemP [Lysobacter sp. OAE881]|jgi:hemin uptake protein HemP|uniref:hemin uptake protein HemP n=1 Tax=Lysobacter TaxID=68 RepID=UPI00178A1C01|nr:hemin uptake protein HemP [Lysobacter soli]MDG2519103.1 hemin uptake protein HemP [Lysobacter soli]